MCRKILIPALFLVALIHLGEGHRNVACVKAPTPDLSAPKRRISDQKCREYNFERTQVEKCSRPPDDPTGTEYPFMGAVGYKYSDETKSKDYSFLCAASLISPNFAVTTAHCLKTHLKDFKPPEIVRFGHSNIRADVPRTDAKIVQLITHPQYQPSNNYFDIGLIKLESNLEWSRYIQPACLWAQDDVLTGLKDVPSWGKAANDPKDKVYDSLRVTKVELMDSADCASALSGKLNRRFPKLQDHHLCANESGSEIILCKGSAGAPIISKVKLDGSSEDRMPYALGITAFGFGCSHKSPSIGIYTRVSSFVSWIEETVWPQ